MSKCDLHHYPFPHSRWLQMHRFLSMQLTQGHCAQALGLLECFGRGQVVLADRNFLSWSLARDVLATGARILWRASASFKLTPVKVLADGTCLAELRPPRKKDGPGITVRVTEYSVLTTPAAGGKPSISEVFCLVTDLLDPEEHSTNGIRSCLGQEPRFWFG